MIDWSIQLPDLCWFHICQHLAIGHIAQLSSTCRILRHLLWSRHSSLWMFLIRLNFNSSAIRLSTRLLLEEVDEEDEHSTIAENDRFSRRLLLQAEAYAVSYERFRKATYYRCWHAQFTSPKKDMRGFIAFERCTYPIFSFPITPLRLSPQVLRLHYYRSNKTSTSTAPLLTLLYDYLINCRRCLDLGKMVYTDNTMSILERSPVTLGTDGAVCVTRPSQSLIPHRCIYLLFQSIPLWTDLLPGCYRLTCQMRLRCQSVNHCLSEETLRRLTPVEIVLLGDRIDSCGRKCLLTYPWLMEQHRTHGDDRWFDVTLISNFVLLDMSNVYFGVHITNLSPLLFDIWINNLQLHFNRFN